MSKVVPERPFLAAQVFNILWNNLRCNKPLLASFKLTYKCNLRCLQCPFCSLEAKDRSFDEILTSLDELYERGNRIVIFEGGEPTLWRDGKHDIQDVLQYARSLFYAVGMTTNGTHPLDLPADIIWVSIDGFEHAHNQLRGADIYQRILTNVRNSCHPKLFAHITVNAVNAAEIPQLTLELDNIFKGITIQFYYPYNHKDELFLPFDRRAALLSTLIDQKKSGVKILNSVSAMKALQHNTWKCEDWLMDNVNPDGSIQQGCYLKGRGDIDCSKCGFSPHTEISLAVRGNIRSMLAGKQIFTS